jgi:ABC-type phosphate transport system substrate-binding protein
VILLAQLCGEASGAPPTFRIVGHPDLPVREVAKKELAAVFLARTERWSDGTAAIPVDQSMRATIRTDFSHDVLGLSMLGVQAHWQKAMSEGQRPPVVRATDADVVAFVATTPGAVGYVSAATRLPATVREIPLTD